MCGIWGVFNHENTKYLSQEDIKVAKTLFLLSHQRGDHSAGFCAVERFNPNSPEFTGKTRTVRSVGSMYSIFHTREGADAWSFGTHASTSVFGHTRYATKGAIKTENAHPFQEGDWVMVHNGTLTGGFTLGDGVEVDSHALCKQIAEVGLKQALTNISGAFAIIAYNTKEKRLYIARNGERPLHYFKHDGMTYVSSESLDVEYALRKHNQYTYYPKTDESAHPQQFKEHCLYVLTETGFVEFDKVPEKPKYTYYPPTVPRHDQEQWKSSYKGQSYEFLPKKVNEEIEFIIDYVEPRGTQFRYEGVTADSDEAVVQFYCSERNESWLGELISVPIHSKIYRKANKVLEYNVKFKDVLKALNLAKTPPKNVTPLNGCIDCGEPIDPNSQFVVTADSKCICESCVNSFKKSTGTSYLKAYIDEDSVSKTL